MSIGKISLQHQGQTGVGHIGDSPRRPNARRLLDGTGRYTGNLQLPRMAHVAFVRSSHAHARIVGIDVDVAAAMPGVVRVITASDLVGICTPWQGTLTHLKMKSPDQMPLANGRVCWQGEAVVAVVAETRALAEDAAAAIDITYEDLPPLSRMSQSLDAASAPMHPSYEDNICMSRVYATPEFDIAFADADLVIEEQLEFSRHTGVPLEPRSIIADYNHADRGLTVHQSHQAPHMMRDLIARHFGFNVFDVRVICLDVGGGFGIKVHSYPDELAVVAASIICKRPVKFIADRFEAMGSDIHAREHSVNVRLGVKRDGTIVGFDMNDIAGIGPYSVYPRTSVLEGVGIANYTGAAYRHKAYRAKLDVVFQNKVPTSQYRSVGHPVATAITETMLDRAARKLGLDPVVLRQKNLIPDDGYPCTSASGLQLHDLSHQECLQTLLQAMDYEGLRRMQATARSNGQYLGIGIAVLLEMTSPGISAYAIGDAPISSQDGATLRLETDGKFTCLVSVGDQGQGTDTAMAQIAATQLGVPFEAVKVHTGDTAATPVGGGAYGSRTTAIGGEAVLLAARDLRTQLLDIASKILKTDATTLTIAGDRVVSTIDPDISLPLRELARISYWRLDKLPKDYEPRVVATRHFVNRFSTAAISNGAQASLVEVDVDTGAVKLLKHWVVEDCGTVVNPKLVDEQIRGAVVMGLGMALYEECRYSEDGQLITASLADYLMPLAGDMPDIEIHHVVTPSQMSQLGAKGAAEAGVAGAPAAVMNAVNDALAPLSGNVCRFPITPDAVLESINAI